MALQGTQAIQKVRYLLSERLFFSVTMKRAHTSRPRPSRCGPLRLDLFHLIDLVTKILALLLVFVGLLSEGSELLLDFGGPGLEELQVLVIALPVLQGLHLLLQS